MKKIEYIILTCTYNLPHFRVTFNDGGMSKAVTIGDAIGFWMEQGGRIWLDYNFM